MAQTNLKADDFCGYNTSAAPFFYTFQPGQYTDNFVYGEVGLNASGGSAGTYVRPGVIDVDSFLSGRDDMLSKCNPPVPGLDEVSQTPSLKHQNSEMSILIAKDTREKKSAADLSTIDYNRWDPNLPVNPQDLRFVISDVAPSRGGMDTHNYTKSAWNPRVSRGSAINGSPEACRTILDPARYSNAIMPGKPQLNYPFVGITSQQIKDVGAAPCGEQMFWGPNYTEGSCGSQPKQTVLLDNKAGIDGGGFFPPASDQSHGKQTPQSYGFFR